MPDVLDELISSPDRQSEEGNRAYLVTARPARNAAELELREREISEIRALEISTAPFEGDDGVLQGHGGAALGVKTIPEAQRFIAAQAGPIGKKWSRAIAAARAMPANTTLADFTRRIRNGTKNQSGK
jgi:hypothetical protein